MQVVVGAELAAHRVDLCHPPQGRVDRLSGHPSLHGEAPVATGQGHAELLQQDKQPATGQGLELLNGESRVLARRGSELLAA